MSHVEQPNTTVKVTCAQVWIYTSSTRETMNSCLEGEIISHFLSERKQTKHNTF